MTLNLIKKFENQNNIFINVYCIEMKKELSILPIRLIDKKKMDKHVNLLYVLNDDDEWNISRGSKIYPVLWAHNLADKKIRNSFEIGMYTLNKNYKIIYITLREKKIIINYISFLQMSLHYFEQKVGGSRCGLWVNKWLRQVRLLRARMTGSWVSRTIAERSAFRLSYKLIISWRRRKRRKHPTTNQYISVPSDLA